MSADLLIDTNVLVYAFDADAPVKRALAGELLDRIASTGRGAVSAQVLGEFYVTIARKFRTTIAPAAAVEHTQDLGRVFHVLDQGLAVVLDALRGVVRHHLHYYDAQIWAVARLNGIPLVLSEDFAEGREIEGVCFANPFAEGFDLDRALAQASSRV